MTLPRDIRLRVTALAQEFEDDGQRYCAADIRLVLAEIDALNAKLAAADDNTRWLGKMESARLRQIVTDARDILRERGAMPGPRVSDERLLTLLRGDPQMTIRQAARHLGIPKGTASGKVTRAGGIEKVRAGISHQMAAE